MTTSPEDAVRQLVAGRKVVILGLGREGLSTYQFVRKYCRTAEIVLSDRAVSLSLEMADAISNDHRVATSLGDTYLNALSENPGAVIFRSPGISPDFAALQRARESGATITSNTGLFFKLCHKQVIGITGTKGKSTTTSLIYKVLRSAGHDVALVGNIGIPPLSVYSPEIELYVAELSSYQLADLDRSPHIAVVQNVVPEHLNYHGDFDAYVRAKSNITLFQDESDFLVFNAAFPVPAQIARVSKAQTIAFNAAAENECRYFVREESVLYGTSINAQLILQASDTQLLGDFNLQNVMPALVVGRLLGFNDSQVVAAIRSFEPLEHRLEPVETIEDVCFFNDSLSTVPEAAMAAITAFSGRRIILIAGGYDRGLDYYELAAKISSSYVVALIYFKPSGEKIVEHLRRIGSELPVTAVETMEDAVGEAWKCALPGDVILLSPASASFERFVDYRDRGEKFKAAVCKLGQDSRG